MSDYLKKRKVSKDKYSWTYTPPRDVLQSKLLKIKTFSDGRTARAYASKNDTLIEQFRSGEIAGRKIFKTNTVKQLKAYYFNSKYFLQLSPSTQESYQRELRVICSMDFGNLRINRVTVSQCRKLYENISEEVSVANANYKATILSVLLNYAVSLELLLSNPMSAVRKLRHSASTTEWTNKQVERLLEVAYYSFETRNVGLLVHMCYEWAQRPTDICNLTWDAFDFENNSVEIEQSKRGAIVTLPLEDPLLSLLKQQKKDWGFQQWVIPHHVPSGSVYPKMTRSKYLSIFNPLKEEADLPSDLKIGSLRKTAINEFLEVGVEIPSLMSVTGHKNIQSLTPYVKHRLETAKKAMERRKR